MERKPKMIKKLKNNTVGKDYFVGDIHGCYEQLMEALVKIKFNPDVDRLISVGDLVDRGADSVKCLNLLKEPWFHAVSGNHEDMMIKSFRREWPTHNYIQNGGKWFFHLPYEEQEQLVLLADTKMPLVIEVETDIGTIGVIHANAPDDWQKYHQLNDDEDFFDDALVEDTIWGRRRIYGSQDGRVNGIDYVVVGHTPVEDVTVLENIIYIDTGAVYNNSLTILSVDEVVNYVGKVV
jgi:serine/threonine protein phosphatase 1